MTNTPRMIHILIRKIKRNSKVNRIKHSSYKIYFTNRNKLTLKLLRTRRWKLRHENRLWKCRSNIQMRKSNCKSWYAFKLSSHTTSQFFYKFNPPFLNNERESHQ
ncbi:hypothetical protein M758_UG118100 [Ceratodon purpureus]|nr:hypothetical protein M758_UG118100 [Ceratodon purpureus]